MKSFDLGGNGQPLHFLHANGYPPDCYKPLLELLQTEYHVFGMTLRPLWENAKPEEINDWTPFSEDLLQFLAWKNTGFDPSDKSNRAAQPVESLIAVGHSIGAIVTLRAALREPGLFRALILIEPVLFLPRRLFAWNTVRALGLGDRFHPLIAGAKKRRRTFDDLDTLFRAYRSRNIFRYMSDVNLRTYIEGMTKPKTEGGYELVFPAEWEAQIYRTGLHDFDIWRDLPKLNIPTLFLRGAESDTFLEGAARLVKEKQPRVKVEVVDKSTHLLPLEYPQKVFDLIRSFLKEVL